MFRDSSHSSRAQEPALHAGDALEDRERRVRPRSPTPFAARDRETELELGSGLIELVQEQVRLAADPPERRSMERGAPGCGLACERVRGELERTLGVASQERGLHRNDVGFEDVAWRPRSPRSSARARREQLGGPSGIAPARRDPAEVHRGEADAAPVAGGLPDPQRFDEQWFGFVEPALVGEDFARCCWCRTRRRPRCRSATAGHDPVSYHSIAPSQSPV